MKPITADNAEGRSLLALRAGPMTPTEISARVGQSVPGWLVKAGYVTQDDSYYRITEAGRAACPYRNPLAAPGVVKASSYKRFAAYPYVKPMDAPGVVQPATFKPETPMPKGEVKTTQRETLALIKAAGAEGITRKKLVESIDASEQSVDNHIWALNRDGAIFKPKLGLLVAIEFKQGPTVSPELARLATPPAACGEQTAKSETQPALPVADAPQAPASPAKQLAALNLPEDLGDLPMPAEAFENIKVKGIPERRGPAVILVEHEEDFEVGIFSDSTMTLVWEDGINAATIEFSPMAVKKLSRFLGLFAEAV
jgi:hypothetical protein